MFRTRRTMIRAGLLTTLIATTVPLVAGGTGTAADPQLAHMVYFKLNDSTGASRAKLVAACKALLSHHAGSVYFAVGTLAGELDREVNDRDFDVSLHIIFANKEAHDKYQQHPRHLKFIEENKENWAKVRVFDSYLSSAAAGRSAGGAD
jgi:Stress responsive A/B Barrel Domain